DPLRPPPDLPDPRRVRGRDARRRDLRPEPLPDPQCAGRGGSGRSDLQGRRNSCSGLEAVERAGREEEPMRSHRKGENFAEGVAERGTAWASRSTEPLRRRTPWVSRFPTTSSGSSTAPTSLTSPL